MNIIEIPALRRSGNHAVMSWLMKNLILDSPTEKQWEKFKITTIGNSKSIFWSEANWDLDYSKELYRNLNYPHNNIFINYEDIGPEYTIFSEDNKYKGKFNLKIDLDINITNSYRFVVIRDFYNNLCSRIKGNEFYDFNYGQVFIDLWKIYAKYCVNNLVHFIKYEDWILHPEIRQNFLKDTFNTPEIIFPELSKGSKSSYNNQDFLNRFDPNIIPDHIKDLIRKDNELHYLIGALGYEFKPI
jgi:hypothetical protein